MSTSQSSTATSMPPSDVTTSTSNSASPLPRPRGCDLVAHAGRRLGVHDRDDRRRRVRRQQAVRVDGLAPGGVDPYHLGPWRSATSHIRSPKTPLTPTTTGSPGRTKLTKEASMPAEPVPLTGRVSAFVVAKTCRRRSLVLVEQRQELRIEVTQHRTGQRHGDFRVWIRRARAHEEAVGYPHRRIVTGPRSPAPTRRGARRVSGRLPAWNGCSTPPGRYRRCLPTSARIRAPTRRGWAGREEQRARTTRTTGAAGLVPRHARRRRDPAAIGARSRPAAPDRGGGPSPPHTRGPAAPSSGRWCAPPRPCRGRRRVRVLGAAADQLGP